MDKKLTDSEIVKALECCSKGVYAEVCEKCAFRNEENKININCFNLEKYALDLINRLQAENDTLRSVVKQNHLIRDNNKSPLSLLTAEIKAEAYKEFAERLKEHKDILLFGESGNHYRISDRQIDNLLKELVGEDNG